MDEWSEEIVTLNLFLLCLSNRRKAGCVYHDILYGLNKRVM